MPSVLSSVTAVKNNILLAKLLETLKDRVSFKAVSIKNTLTSTSEGFMRLGSYTNFLMLSLRVLPSGDRDIESIQNLKAISLLVLTSVLLLHFTSPAVRIGFHLGHSPSCSQAFKNSFK